MGLDFPCSNNPKDLDPSYKMDLDCWDCFGKGKNLLYNLYFFFFFFLGGGGGL